MTAEGLCWVYGVVRQGHPGAGQRAGLDGMDPVELLAFDQFSAAVSRNVDEAVPTALSEDPAQLQKAARAHDAVLQDLAGQGDVLPIRFATICTERDLAAVLQASRAALLAAFEHVEGQQEWGVQLFWQPGGHQTATPSEGPGAGRAYLARRRDETVRRAEQRETGIHAAQAVHARLEAVASDAVRIKVQPQQVTGRSDEMVFNAAYLVPQDEATRFRMELATAEQAGLTPVLTGPWPAHHFVDLRLEGARQ